MQPRKIRLPRVERDEIVEVHDDENAHLWAVSYADFLMALLSFFILFFSMDPPEREKIVLQLAGEFKQSGLAIPAGGYKKEVPKSATEARLPSSILDAIKNLNVSVSKDKGTLLIDFPDDIFSAGKHKLKNEKENLLIGLLDVIKPYEGKINVYFEGHSDSSPLLVHKNNIIVDNFVLSSLRASTALQTAKLAGFSEKYLFIQADSSNVRNSRSLSVRIEPHQEVQ